MTALTDDERRELDAQSVRSVCERLAPEVRVRVRAVAYGEESGQRTGFDTALWDVLCNQVGIAAIAPARAPWWRGLRCVGGQCRHVAVDAIASNEICRARLYG